MFSCALPLQKHSYLFVGKVKGRSATDGELSPISGGHYSVFFLFIHLNEPTAFFFLRVCLCYSLFAGRIVICVEFVNNQSCGWFVEKREGKEAKWRAIYILRQQSIL